MNRRDFLRYSLLGAGALGLKLYSIPAFALDGRKEKLIYIFLRGGADFLSLFPPKLDPSTVDGAATEDYINHPLYAYRGQTKEMCKSFLFGSKLYPFGDYVAESATAPLEFADYPVDFHPGFSALTEALRTDNVAVLLHTGSMNGSRSHFDQEDMIESGSDRLKFPTGYLARAASVSRDGSASDEAMRVIAIGEKLPKSLNGADVPVLLSANDVKGPESVAGKRVYAARYENRELLSGMDLQARLEYFKNASDKNCESIGLCKSAKGAQDRYKELEKDLEKSAVLDGSTFKKACSFAAQLSNASFNPAIMTIDFPGWDHHFGEHPKVEKSALYAKVTDLAEGLNQLYTNMSDETVVVVMSEFGRTVVGNQSLGTDHGRGGAMMLMGRNEKSISRKKISKDILKVPAAWDLKDFDGQNSSRALRVKIDYREIMAELLQEHLGITWTANSKLKDPHISTIFDGLKAFDLRGLVK